MAALHGDAAPDPTGRPQRVHKQNGIRARGADAVAVTRLEAESDGLGGQADDNAAHVRCVLPHETELVSGAASAARVKAQHAVPLINLAAARPITCGPAWRYRLVMIRVGCALVC